MNTLGIILASAVLAVSGGWLGLSPKANAVLAGVSAICVITYLLVLLPDFLIRFCLWLLTHSIYRIRIVGPDNVPLNGPALLVANHLSFIDGLLVGACVQRFVRFMVYAPFFEIPLLGKLFKLMRAIPTGGGGARGASARSRAREAAGGTRRLHLRRGAISRTGNMLPFKRGFEKITNGPRCRSVHLDQVWGSIFSFKDGRFFWKWPRVLHPVTITFGNRCRRGARLDVRQKLLRWAASSGTGARRRPGHRCFVTAKHSWRRFAMTDSLAGP
jgi:acyl-[acyl-carrier-protein]-phospholipid O-acyltransferase/long-chain-fatty-acid--[acyl-carrier-protein] ligase